MEQVSIIPFYNQREQAQVVAPATFRRRLREHGFTVTQTRPVYTDAEVLQQQWLVCPNGAIYPDHTFYRLFGTTGFRKLFRYALIHVPCTRAMLESFCPNELHLTQWLTFLQDQKWFHWDGRWLDQGHYLRFF